MNMLIVGNGFDLAHGRPTKYEHFLQFLDCILRAKDYIGDKAQFEATLNIDYPVVRDYILSSFDTRQYPGSASVGNKNNVIQELYNCLDNNAWYTYFYWIRANDLSRGKNWVDFESEIRTIIDFVDHQINDLYDSIPLPPRRFPDCPKKVGYFLNQLDFTAYNARNQRNKSYQNTYFDFIDKTYQDLNNLIRCLEIYLDDCVGKMPITYYSPDIQEFEIDSVLSFDYTAIPTNIYPSLIQSQSMKTYPSLVQVHYIHGCAKTDRPMEENNMVLGVNEYWDGPKKDFCTNFNCYKKFVQRIIKETGIDYKKSIEQMRRKYDEIKEIYSRDHPNHTPPYPNHVYIFGHSLDITDGDILKEIIQTPGVDTTIFYRNKQQQANQIANLSKVLGQDELLKRTFSISPTIIFKQQRNMVKL